MHINIEFYTHRNIYALDKMIGKFKFHRIIKILLIEKQIKQRLRIIFRSVIKRQNEQGTDLICKKTTNAYNEQKIFIMNMTGEKFLGQLPKNWLVVFLFINSSPRKTSYDGLQINNKQTFA